MGEIVNLRQVKKQRAKAEAAAQAAENRTKFGRTPAEKQTEAAAEARRRALLDGARIEQGSQDPAKG